MVRAQLIVCTLTVLLQAHFAVAQSDNVNTALQGNAGAATQVAGEAQETDAFIQLLDRAIETTSKRTLTANSHSPWQIFHCILAMRDKAVLRLGDQKVNAIEWLATTEPQFDKQPLLLLTPHGAKFHPYTRMYAFEGHPSQFLALLTHANLPPDYQFHVQGKVVTLSDLLYNTMQEVNTKEEVTWVLWALQHYLKPDAVWTNQNNETWSIERLVKIESETGLDKAACGGNHRLFALTRARDKYLKYGGQLRGVWFQADQKIKQHIELARSLQNNDGTFSADSYKGPGHTTDVNKRFNTTGHTMEFLAISLPNERLNEPWVRNAVWTLSRELIIHRDTKIDCGPLFHSLDALILYRERLRALSPATETAPPTDSLADKPAPTTTENAPKLDTAPKELAKPAKPVIEPKRVAQKPTEVKLSTPPLQSVPMPIAEPIVVPESQPDQPRLEPPVLQVPQAKASKESTSKIATMKPRASTPNPNVPRIDPSKLPNVGQVVAPRNKPAETLRTARRDGAPPALLPDIDATPLKSEARPKPPIPISIPDEPDLSAKLQPGSLAPEKKEEVKESIAIPEIEDLDLSAPNLTESTDEAEEPASAMEPANP